MSMIILSLITILGQVSPFSGPTQADDENPVVPMTVRSCTPTACMGQYVMIACSFSIPEGWRVYWSNPGASGAPTTIEVQGPNGLIIDPVRYPRPRIFGDGSEATYGYEDQLTLLIPVRVPDVVPEGMKTLDLIVRGEWFVCRERCFIGSSTKSIQIPLGTKREPLESWVASLLGQFSWPKSLTSRPRTTATYEDGNLVITGPATKAGEIGFIPDPSPGVELGKHAVTINEGDFSVKIPVRTSPSDMLGQEPVVRGLLTFGDEATMTSYQILVPLPVPGRAEDSPREEQRNTQP